MSEYTDISSALKIEMEKGAELQEQIQACVQELLSAFWKEKSMLKVVDRLELKSITMSTWITSRLSNHG